MSVLRPPLAASLPLFAGAPAEALLRLDAALRVVRFESNQQIIGADDESRDVFCILDGTARVIVRAANGRERLLGEIGRGEFFGEMAAIDGAPRSANVTAFTRVEVCIVPAPAFIDIVCACPPVCLRLLGLLSDRVRAANARLLEDAAMPIRLRLYAELLRLSHPHPASTARIIVPRPREDVLAARIGGRREAVSRAIADLVRRGALARTPLAFLLTDPAGLRRAIDRHLENRPPDGDHGELKRGACEFA